MANKFSLDKRDIKQILESNEFKKRIEKVKGNTCEDIFQDFELSENDALIKGLISAIDDNKFNEGGLPKGSIKFGGWEISIDDIFDEFPRLQRAYINALKAENEDNKNQLFKLANNKLTYAILLLLSSGNIEAINNPSAMLKIKSLIIDGQDIEKPKKRRISMEKFVSRDNIARQLAKLRDGRSFPDGTIELRPGITKNLNRMAIFSHFKNLYQNARNEMEKIRLDTQFAEQIILKSNYYVQIDNKFISPGDVNFKDEDRLINDMYGCRDSLNSIGFSTESLIIEDDNGEKYYIVRKKTDVIPPVPTGTPTESPTETPTESPTETPTESPTETPTESPTETPTESPTETPTESPTETPTESPTETPTESPTETPTESPTIIPTPTETEKPTETPTPNYDEPTSFEESVVLSDVSESYEDMISREVENEINEEWHNTARYNVIKRGKLRFSRGRIRKNRIKRMKELYERTPFTSNGTINREMVKQATRHNLEEVLQGKGVNRSAFGKIKRENMIAAGEVSGDPLYETTRGKEFREMAQDYVSGRISQVEFQNKFNEFVHDKLGLPKEQQFVATNILERLDAIKNDNELLMSITSDLQKYLTDHNSSHFDDVHKKINDDFIKYRRDPRFRKKIMDILGNTAGLTKDQLDEEINKFIRHQKALANASATNLQIKLDLLTNGKGAYQINNKDRENWLFKLGHKFDKMPRYWQTLTAIGISASGALVAAGLPVIGLGGFTVMGLNGAAFAGTATLSTLVGAKNFIKKWTHHTKEQNTYEKNLVRDYEKEIAQMKEREKVRTEKDSEGKYTHGRFERYRAKRQLELYGKSTQSELQNENTGNTKELADFIYTALDRYDTLTPEEKNALNCTLLDSKARLETYWNMGHNFLKSKDKSQIERDFYNLENALNLAATRVLKDPNATLKDVSLVEAFDEDGKIVDYNDLLNLYKKDYNSATKKFRGERAWLATKRGLGTALVTFGTAYVTQAITHTGMHARNAVQGTPDISESHETLSRQEATDYYKLGQWERYETNDNAIFKAAQDNISNLRSGNGVSYGVKVNLISGTDGSQLAPGSPLLDPNTYKTELEETIRALGNSKISNKWEIINRLKNSMPTDGFTNGALYSMRDLNAIEKIATGAGNFNGSMEFVQDVAHGIDGQIPNNMWDRLTRATIEVTKTTADKMGTAAVEAGKQHYIIPVFCFDNTFKRRNGGTPKNKGNDKGKDGQPDNPPSTGENGGNDNGGDIVPPIIVGGKGKDKGNEKGDKKEPDKILPPVDPNDPAGPTDEKKPREKITGERKGIITRGHLINSDIDDLGEEYPGSGEMLPTHDSALLLFGRRKANDLECFTEEDINELRNLSGNDDAQIRYLESKIIEDRNIINDTENNETMRKFNDSMETSKQWIRKFLPEIVGDIDSQLLNKFLADKRIHVVSDREYIGVIGSNRRSSGLFRGESGDLYIRYSYIQAYEDERIYGDNSYWTGMNRHLTLIHEMVHSMSTMNYLVSEEDGKLKYDRRRVGLQQFRYDRNGKYLGETGRSMNEASTELLCWEICRRGFNSIGLDLSPYREEKITYKAFIDVIDQLGEIDHIKSEDFWKAMLIRKRAKDKDIELDTPLFELVGKVDGRQEENGKIKYSRPSYYNLISNSMDFAHTLFNERNVDGFETRWIIDFIIKKDIIILKDYVQFQHKKLSDVFDKDLLTKDGKDFRQEILDAYNGR